MEQYIGCDGHKKYSVFGFINRTGKYGSSVRVDHTREEYRSYLRSLPAGSSIALECIGNWYWMIDEMERAGHRPSLVHPRKAKLMMGQINKTDKLDANGLAMLSRNGTLPTVWIPSGELRDQRELVRMRMSLVSIRTKLKNRIHATLAKYNLIIEEVSDVFGVQGRRILDNCLSQLPPETRHSVKEQLKLLDEVQDQIKTAEKRIQETVKQTPQMQLLKTLPGVGPIPWLV